MSLKQLKTTTKILLLSVVALTPFINISSLYFPAVSGRVYVFRFLVALAFFFWIWLLLRESGIRNQELGINFRNVLIVALFLFFLAQVFVSFFGVDPIFSFFSSISRSDGVLQFGFWLLYFLMLIAVFKNDEDWKILFSIFVIVAFLVSIFAWLGFPSGQEIYGNVFDNPAYFSGFLIFAIGFSLLLAVSNFFKAALINNLFLVAAIFFAITLIFTQIRGAFIGLVGGVFLFAILSTLFLRNSNRKFIYFSGIIGFAFLIFLIFVFSARETEFVRHNQFLSRLAEAGGSPLSQRILIWQTALDAFYEKPVLGYGPENFATAFNKHYNHFLGEKETWLDRAHNIPLDILAAGGILLFCFYLFWLLSTAYLIFRIAKEKKLLSFILAATFFAYFLQGLFLFDSFATFLGLFPFLAYLIYLNSKFQIPNSKQAPNPKLQIPNKFQTAILVGVAAFSIFVIYTTVIIPWRANAAALQFYTHTDAGFYKEAKPFLEKSFSVKSPYTYWEVRREASWQFLAILEDQVQEDTAIKDIQVIEEIYDFITPELERFIAQKPQDSQMYYVLGRIYLAGFDKLQRDDLGKAEAVLRKALNFSDLRKEYFEELKRALIWQRKFEEAEKLLQGYLERVDFHDYYPYLTMGHFYFETEKYEKAIEQYERAKETGYDFCQILAEYSRYMFSAEKTGLYQKVVDMAENCLEKTGPNADAYFNIAVGYFHLGQKEKAAEFFLKALELNPVEYEEHKDFFD